MQLGWLLVMLDQTQSGRSPGYEYLLLFHLPHLKIQVSHNLRDWNLASVFVPAYDSQTRGQSPTSLRLNRIHILYLSPNLGFEIAISVREREQGRFRGSREGVGESKGVPREHYEAVQRRSRREPEMTSSVSA